MTYLEESADSFTDQFVVLCKFVIIVILKSYHEKETSK